MNTIAPTCWKKCLIGLLSAFLIAPILGGQTSDITDMPFAPTVAPGRPEGVYSLSNLESVNLFNGRLSVFLPIWTAKGRHGLSLPLGISIGTQWSVQIQGHGTPTEVRYPQGRSADPSFSPGGLSILETNETEACSPGSPIVTSTLTRLQFTEYDGTTHELRDTQTNGAPYSTLASCQSGGFTKFNRSASFATADGSTLSFISDNAIFDAMGYQPSAGYLRDPDGMTYRIDRGGVTWIRDRNGDVVHFTYDTTTYKLSVATDALGRSLTIGPEPTSPGTRIVQYSGGGGQMRTVSIVYDNLANLLRNGGSVLQTKQLFPESADSNPVVNSDYFDPLLPSQVSLPNHDSYQFQYNVYGEVAKIVLPTGGSYEYEWGSGWPGNADGMGCDCPIILRRITERREYDRGALVGKTTYEFAGSESPAVVGSTIVTVHHWDAAGAQIAVEKHFYYSPPLGDVNLPELTYPWWQEGREYRVEYYDGSGSQLLRTQTTTWAQRDPGTNQTVTPIPQTKANDPRIVQEDTTLENGLVQRKTYGYSADAFNNRTDVYEYDWGQGSPGALLRHTSTSYVATPAYTDASVHLLRLPAQVNVYAGASTLASLTYYGYDERALTAYPTIVGHDGAFGAGYTTRGNLTTKKDYINTSNSYRVTKYDHDIAGNVTSITDPDGHSTTFSYNDTCNLYARPLTVTNSASQSTTLGYDYGTNCVNGTGNLIFSIDPNGVKTAYDYGDDLDRLTQIRHVADTPRESQTNIVYSGATDVNVYRDQSTKDDRKLHSETIYDGFGRESESRQYESADSYISISKSYDALGRLASTTNPSRVTNGQSDGLGYVTTMSYDALGRMVSVKTPDGAATTTSYTGNQTTVTDAAGKSRQYTYSALGMLTKVLEHPSGLNYTTSYQYDVLADLTQVTQGSEIRSFGYDSLGQLLWAVNPESGTINYRYDAGGNLVWRDDNMGRQTCYSYDALNRVAQKIYFTGNYAAQGGNCAAVPGSAYLADSPTVSYSYDSANISYGTGRLAKVTNGISTTTVLSYDAEGRTLASQQSTGGKTYNLFYGYDLSGALTSETYPSGRQITTQFDGAGREAKINGALGGQPSTYLGSVSYAPHGGAWLMQYGNNVWHTVNYNSRLQPYQALDIINNENDKLLRAECMYWGGSYDLTACGATNHTDNNGNLRATVFWYGNGGTSVSASFNETFAYDGVNRLTGVVDNGGWSRYFAYDQYSNMWICGSPGIAPNGAAPAANYCSQTPSNIFNTANQIIGRSYDAAGNMTSLMGSNFTYDADNRITTAVQPGIGTVTYTYDGDGRRVMKAVSTGLQTVYVYDIGGKLVAEYSSGPVSIPPCHTCFLSSDHLGSTRLVTDEDGNTVSRHDYIPFGEEIAANTGGRDGTFGTFDFVNQKFTGKERDQETGLDYFGARYYGSTLGRFTSPDEFKGGIVDPFTGQDIETNTALPYADITDPQTLNKYAYVRNNPLRYTDPNGHCIEDLCIGEGALVYAGYTALAGATAAYLASPSGQQAIQATGQLIQGGLNGVQNLITLATGNDSQQAQSPGPPSSQSQPDAQSGDKPAYAPTQENVDRMKQGKAPVGNDGNPVELHHQDQNPQGPVKEMTRADHRGPGNYSDNHPEGNKQPSRIDRNEAARQRRQYWKEKARQHEDQ